ncbi:MAG: hypothetical protein GC136_08240 [Alphaproteobacteria bacterium]|nr:hypothetical protein [Alphaproteobacteria bacterium]
MSSFDDNARIFVDLTPLPNCRVSYTLGTSQPVRSSFIGDQPLFYLENEETLADDPILADLPASILEEDFEELKQRFDAYERVSKDFAIDWTDKAKLFEENCESFGAAPAVESKLERVLEKMNASRFAAELLNASTAFDLQIKLSAQYGAASFDKNANTIYLNPSLDDSILSMLAVRELRRAWQYRQGALLNPLTLYPDHAILVNRLQSVDLLLAMLRSAWEMQLAGDKSAWTWIENGTMADLGRAFAREACIDFRTLNNGRATQAALEAWFLSERCRKHDRTLIQHMLAAPQNGPFQNLQDSSRAITLSFIESLGRMPFGKNYLVGKANVIMQDAIFCEVRDRSNANFLWFIKFERSFNESERELQKGGVEPTQGTPAHASVSPASATRDGHSQMAQEAAGSNVVSLAQWASRQHNGKSSQTLG